MNRSIHKKFNEIKAVIKWSKCPEPTKGRCPASMVQKIPCMPIPLHPPLEFIYAQCSCQIPSGMVRTQP